MVICIIALVIFGILGIFSAKYRRMAKEAFRCVSRRVTLRKCEMEFDRKMRAKLTAKFSRFPSLANFVYRHFELLSWIFVIALFVSFYFIAIGIYNLIVFGTCDPVSGLCIFNP